MWFGLILTYKSRFFNQFVNKWHLFLNHLIKLGLKHVLHFLHQFKQYYKALYVHGCKIRYGNAFLGCLKCSSNLSNGGSTVKVRDLSN